MNAREEWNLRYNRSRHTDKPTFIHYTCLHCCYPEHEHGESGKCLFEPTKFEAFGKERLKALNQRIFNEEDEAVRATTKKYAPG